MIFESAKKKKLVKTNPLLTASGRRSRQAGERRETHIDRDLGSVRVLNRGVVAFDPFIVDELSCTVC